MFFTTPPSLQHTSSWCLCANSLLPSCHELTVKTGCRSWRSQIDNSVANCCRESCHASHVSIRRQRHSASKRRVLQGSISHASHCCCISRLNPQPAARGTASLKATIFTIAQNTLGAGLLTMPFSFKVRRREYTRTFCLTRSLQRRPQVASIVPAMIITLFVGILSAYSFLLLSVLQLSRVVCFCSNLG
jgi:hypothetical protein